MVTLRKQVLVGAAKTYAAHYDTYLYYKDV